MCFVIDFVIKEMCFSIDFNNMYLFGLVFLLYVFKLSIGFGFYENYNQEIISKGLSINVNRYIQIFPKQSNNCHRPQKVTKD